MSGQVPTIRVARDTHAFEALRADWAIAAQRAGTVRFYQDFDWNRTWWSAGAAADRGFTPYVVVVGDTSGPAGVLPLMLRRDRRLPTLDWMASDVTDYCDAIVAADADAGAVMAGFRAAMEASGAAMVDLRQIRPDSTFARLVPESIENDPREGRAIFVATAGVTEDQFQKGLNAELRKTMRRRTRRLSEQVQWRFTAGGDPAERMRALEFCLTHKRGQLAKDPAALASHDAMFVPFARAIFANGAVGTARPVMTAIMAGDRFISAHLGFQDAGRMYYYLTAHDPEFERVSPGTLLAVETIKHCCRTGAPLFDMLRGDYAFKWAISNQFVPLMAYRRGLSLAGRAYLPVERLARVARRRWREARKARPGVAKAA